MRQADGYGAEGSVSILANAARVKYPHIEDVLRFAALQDGSSAA